MPVRMLPQLGEAHVRLIGSHILHHPSHLARIHLTNARRLFHDPPPELPPNQAPGLGFGSAKKNDRWTKTLHLPSTKFDIRANAAKREPLFRQRTTTDLYRWQASQTDRPLFVLHDGPPYANGRLHMGHAMNKIVKDVINRYQVLIGKRVHYHPGWDCHGLPIENKVFGRPEFSKLSLKTAPPNLIRTAAAEEAQEAIEEQRESFRTFGLMADWSQETTYRTFDRDFVRRQFRVMREMVRRGLIYRARRPVYWSQSSRSALAEAEVEYDEGHMSRSVYVRFPIKPGKKLIEATHGHGAASTTVKVASKTGVGLPLIIWTTTPWTLPSNMAININPSLSYSIVRPTEGPCEGEEMIVATDRIERLENLKIGLNTGRASQRPVLGPLEVLLTFDGSALLDSTYRHPYLPEGEKNRPILSASYVTADSGTGIVHSAPGHGQDDYTVWQEFCRTTEDQSVAKEAILSPVDEDSRFTNEVRGLAMETKHEARDVDEDGSGEGLAGLPVISAGTGQVIKELYDSGALLTEQHISHRYPIDWRTSQPIIVRCTSQWFANLEPIKEKALAALQDVKFTPESGRARLEALIRKRSEWCISRQRVWGVPIPVIYNAKTDEPLLSTVNMKHIEKVLDEKGVDYWWQADVEELVAPSERKPGVQWRKGQDIVDVWFDSGSSWGLLPDVKEAFDDPEHLKVPGHPVADVYLEGTDQHRGWFQSSLLTYIAMGAQDTQTAVSAPYRNVITHGFINDRKGDKMSKSRGNIMLPSFFIKGGAKNTEPAFGTDVLRVWATRGDPWTDVTVSSLVVKHCSEALRKLRNTCRFLLANLPEDDVMPKLEEQQLGIMERYILNELYKLDNSCRQAYDTFDFAQVVRRISDFSNSTMSSLFLDVAKDTLYSDPLHGARRQATIAIMDQTLRTMTSVLAPIVPHLAEEIYHFYQGAQADPAWEESNNAESFFQLGWQRVPDRYRDEEAEREFGQLLAFRTSMLALMEKGRQSKLLKASLGVDMDIVVGEASGPTSSDTASSEALKVTLRKHAAALADSYLLACVNVVDRLPDFDEESRPTPEWTLDGEHEGIQFILRPASGQKCPRCWTYRLQVEDGEVCGRCQTALQLSQA